MTRAQSVLYRARHVLWTLGVLLFVGGAAAVCWLLVDRAELADRLENEANLRGTAVSTLAGDVRALRAQVQAQGETPVAPDPTKAVEDLPDLRAAPWDGITGPRPEGKIGFSSVRAGGIVGEHTVMFASDDEVLTLSHSAIDRSLFAKGAVAAAAWVRSRKPGLYDMQDVLGFRQA